MGLLERHLDLDAVNRVLNKVKLPAKELKRVKPPRSCETYRAARRNKRRV